MKSFAEGVICSSPVGLRSLPFFSARSQTDPRRRQNGSQAHGFEAFLAHKKLFSVQKCCFNAKLMHQQSICTSHFVRTENKHWPELRAVGAMYVKKGGDAFCLPASSPHPCVAALSRALSPGEHPASPK